MALSGCGVACKYIIIVFNIIFAVLGLAFLGFGLWLRFSDNTRPIFQIEELNSSVFVTAVTMLITIGAVMLVLVAFGDHGACNEKRGSLLVFSVLLFILFMATQAVVGVLCNSKRGEIGQYLSEFYSNLYTLYVRTSDPAIGVVLTFIQEIVHCCGMTGIVPLELVKKTCPKPDGFFDQFLPSCPGVIANMFDEKAFIVIGAFTGIGALLLIALICSMILSCKISQANSAPRYIILTQTISPVHPHGLVYTNSPNGDPVVFTPLTDANLPLPLSASLLPPAVTLP